MGYYEDWVVGTLDSTRNVAAAIINNPLSWFYSLVTTLRSWIWNHQIAVHNEIAKWKLIEWVGWIPGALWLIDRILNAVDWLFTAVGEGPLYAQNFLNALWDWPANQWKPTLWLINAFETVKAVFRTLGYFWDHWQSRAADIFWDFINTILDVPGWGVGEAIRILTGGNTNPWPGYRASHPNSWEALKRAFSDLGTTLKWRFDTLGNYAWDLINAILEVPGWGVGEAIRILTGGNTNPWPGYRASSPNSWEALKRAFTDLGIILKNRFADLLSDVTGLITTIATAITNALLAPIRSLLTSWEGAITWVKDFAQDPAGKVWAILTNTLLPKVEAFLNERWDAWV